MNTKAENAFPLPNKGANRLRHKGQFNGKTFESIFSGSGTGTGKGSVRTQTKGGTLSRSWRKTLFLRLPNFSEGRTTIRLARCGAKNWIPCKTYELALILTASLSQRTQDAGRTTEGARWVGLDASNYVYGPLNAPRAMDMCAYSTGPRVGAIILSWLTLWRSFDGHKSQLVFHLNGS